MAAIEDRLELVARALGQLSVSIEEVNRDHGRIAAPKAHGSRHVGPHRDAATASAGSPRSTRSPKTSARARARHPARRGLKCFQLRRYAAKTYGAISVSNPSGFTPRILQKTTFVRFLENPSF
ncbi:MAG: hypothetical protein IT167_31905 [Bryobacterales bacterium]|nr:hypothetical protein [Bryobacterales bacterium]